MNRTTRGDKERQDEDERIEGHPVDDISGGAPSQHTRDRSNMPVDDDASEDQIGENDMR